MDFQNTKKAFAHLTDRDLQRAVLLFRLVGSPVWVRVGKVLLNVALALRVPIAWAIRPTIYSHFCGGEAIPDCEPTIAKLAGGQVHTILDYSAEGAETEAEHALCFSRISSAISATRKDPRHAFSVFKVTGLASHELLEQMSRQGASGGVEWAQVVERVTTLCERAVEQETKLLIDAEESWIQPAVDRLAEDMMARFNTERPWIFTTIQLYRHDRLAYLKSLHEGNSEYHVGVKLVRGAYMEKERARADLLGYIDPIHPNKAASDRDFDAALRFCVEHLDRFGLCCGSHNEASNELLARCMDEHKLARADERVWFAQLLGMSDAVSFNLAAAGFNVAKYVPFGPIREAVPYLLRRAEENTSVAGQSSRELAMLRTELSRRRALGRG
jgi:proline dehydrogenase